MNFVTKYITRVTVTELNTVEVKTDWAAKSGSLSYSSAINTEFTALGAAEQMTMTCPTTPWRLKTRVSKYARIGERISLIRLEIYTLGNLKLNFVLAS